MEKQLKGQYCWQAIEKYQQYGNEGYQAILRAYKSWSKINLKPGMIIKGDCHHQLSWKLKPSQMPDKSGNT